MKKTLAILLLAGTTFLTGCGSDREDFVLTNTNNQVVAAPICADDAYTTNQNVQLVVNAATGVLANDTPNGATLTFPATTTQGGTLTGNQDGSYTYTPPNNFNGTDTFAYTLGNSGGVVTCTVTITVNVVNGFFVDSVNGNDGTGNFTGGLPFATVQAAITAAGTNQDIVVRPGNYTGAVTLLNGQRLLGNGSGLAVNPQGTVRPVFTGPINMADGNTVDFIRVANAPDDSIVGDSQNGGTISNCEIVNSGDLGISLATTVGTWTITSNLIDGTGPLGLGILADDGGGAPVNYLVTDNTIRNCEQGAISVFAVMNQPVRTQIENNVMINTVSAGATYEGVSGFTANHCSRIAGNTNDDNYRLSRSVTATYEIERFLQLTSINSGGATVSTSGGSQPPTQISDGDCNF